MPFDDLPLPGLKVRRNKDGTARLLWIPRADLVAAGFLPKSVRLPSYDLDDPVGRRLASAACQKYQAEMLAWSRNRDFQERPYDGTLKSLIRLYQRDKASPYAELKWNTRRTYDQVLDVIEKAFGSRVLPALRLSDFRTWYDAASAPRAPGGPPRVRKAHGIIGMLRRLFSFGIMLEISDAARLKAILDEARFKQPGRRRVALSYDQAASVVEHALAIGRASLALGTALQFETSMRQRDVIGEWEPLTSPHDSGGIQLNGRRWVNGLTWSDISGDLEVRKATTKTGALVAHDLTLCPLVIRVLAHVPADGRIGPLIVDEDSGRPYAEHAYAREWRKVARAAGVPDHVWNMDARAGGISEADEAGAAIDEIQRQVGHSQLSTTQRYARAPIGKSRKVAKLRIAHRSAKNGA